MAEEDRCRCLERTRFPECRGKDDEQVKEGTESRGGDDDGRDGPTEIPHVSGQSVTEEEERDLHDEGETFHDHLEAPSDHPPHPELPVAAALDERSFDVEIEPLFSKHGQECSKQCARE